MPDADEAMPPNATRPIAADADRHLSAAVRCLPELHGGEQGLSDVVPQRNRSATVVDGIHPRPSSSECRDVDQDRRV